MQLHRVVPSVILAVAFVPVLSSLALADLDEPASAEAIFQRAQDRFAQANLESRVAALRDFAAASDMAP